MELLVGQVDKPGAIGNIPVPANTPVALLMQGNAVVGSWAGDAVYGIPKSAAAWRDAHGRASSVDVTLVDPSQLAAVLSAHNKLFA